MRRIWRTRRIRAPVKQEAHEEKLAEKAEVAEGDVFFGNYRKYREPGNMIGSKGGFGWFKVAKIEGDTYHIAKGTELSDDARPKEEMNREDFEEEASAMKARELSAYYKRFVSEDGLVEFSFQN